MVPAVHPLHHADTGTWSYVVADPATREAALIDPVLDYDAKSARTSTASAEALLDVARTHGYRVRWLLETHAHADHLTAAQWLQAQLPEAVLAIGAGIRDVQRHFAAKLEPGDALPSDGSQFAHLFADDDPFHVGGLAARAIPVPGHTRDSLAYLIGDALFTGDSLFMPDAGTARCDFPGGDAATLHASIRRLFDTCPTTPACSSATTTVCAPIKAAAARSPARARSANRSAATSMSATASAKPNSSPCVPHATPPWRCRR